MKTRQIDLWLFLWLAALILIAASCKTQAPIARNDTITKTVIQEVLKDTTVYVYDSAGFKALLECDSLGQVRVKQIQDFYAGQFIKPTVIVKDNYVTLDCKVDSAAIYVTWKERNETTEQAVTIVKVDRVNYLTSWQHAQVWAGRLLFALVLIYAGFKLLRRYTSLKI